MKEILKKILFGTVASCLLISNGFAIEPYIEGQVGVGVVEDVSGATLIRTGGFNLAVSVDDLSYENGLLFGGEFGFKNIVPNSNLRMGFGITTFEAEFEDFNTHF